MLAAFSNSAEMLIVTRAMPGVAGATLALSTAILAAFVLRRARAGGHAPQSEDVRTDVGAPVAAADKR